MDINNMINKVGKMGGFKNKEKEETKTIPLSMMSDEVKVAYIKMVCNYAFCDDQKIDAKEYAEIISLIVRIELDSSQRISIREYMTNHENAISNEDLIDILKSELDYINFDMISKSLIKDIIYVSRSKNKKQTWNDDEFIIMLAKLLEINNAQIDIIEKAIINDEEILLKRKNDSEITKSMKDLAAKTAAVGVPLAAIYLSGSVVGISAAGMTSGLATLGLGGLLGFSSMFTGIGVVVLIGVGTYKGLKKVTGINDVGNNKQRELMLQAIIRNSQKSLNYLIEDVNEITRLLSEELEKGIQVQDKIKELTRILGMLSKGARETNQKMSLAEVEKVIARLPKYIDIMRVEELTNTSEKYGVREMIISCYEPKLRYTDHGKNDEIYELKYKLSIEQLIDLENILEKIGYNKVANASIASIKGTTKKFVNNLKN